MLAASPPDAHAAPLGDPDAIALAEAIFDGSGTLESAYIVTPDPAAHTVGDQPLGQLPTAGSTYAVLSSGDAGLLHTANNDGGTSTDLGGDSERGNSDLDVTILRLDFTVPAGANCLVGLDFQFFSEEYPEFVNSSYNDAFIAELDGTSWTTDGSVIDAPGNFAFDPTGSPITINAAGNTSMSPENAEGTTYDGATPLLRAATPITSGEHSLFLSIFDQGDHVLDSTVVIDNLQFGAVDDVSTDCQPGAVPIDDADDDLGRYVVMGDSFSSGEGTEYYYGDSGKCHRSPYAWGDALDDMLIDEGDMVANLACSGARINQMLYEGRYVDDVSQVERLRRLVDGGEQIDAVLFTIGGNDMNFKNILTKCRFLDCGDDPRIVDPYDAVDRLFDRMSDEVLPKLRQVVEDDTEIILVGYPRLFPNDHSETTGCGWLEPLEREFILGTQAAMQVRGFWFAEDTDAHFVPSLDALDSHEMCSSQSYYYNVTVTSRGGWARDPQQAHPNIAGYLDWARHIEEQLRAQGLT